MFFVSLWKLTRQLNSQKQLICEQITDTEFCLCEFMNIDREVCEGFLQQNQSKHKQHQNKM